MNLSEVKAYYKTHRVNYSESFRLRIHRAVSWMTKAEERAVAGDEDFCFQALWIAFNAAYAKEIDGRAIAGDRSEFRSFLQTVCQLDKDGHIYTLVWQRFSGPIRLLLDNRYVFQPFWDSYNGWTSKSAWLEEFERAKKKAYAALATQDKDMVLLVLFDRLYTLRNQIIHGGATYGSEANREQLSHACKILTALLPEIIQIMQLHADRDWGRPFYPMIKND